MSTATEPDGRWVGDSWFGARTNYTANCAEKDGAGCTGWIAPLQGERPCMDPRHDGARMAYEQARELTEQRVTAADQRQRDAADDDTDSCD